MREDTLEKDIDRRTIGDFHRIGCISQRKRFRKDKMVVGRRSSTFPGSGLSPSLINRTSSCVCCPSHSARPGANSTSTCWTITMLALKPFGKPARIFVRTRGPPVEAPMASNGLAAAAGTALAPVSTWYPLSASNFRSTSRTVTESSTSKIRLAILGPAAGAAYSDFLARSPFRKLSSHYDEVCCERAAVPLFP